MGLPSVHGGGHVDLWTSPCSDQPPELFMKLRVVSSLWGQLVLTQRWAAGAFRTGRPAQASHGAPSLGSALSERGPAGTEPTLLLAMSWLAASARPNGQCPGTPCSGRVFGGRRFLAPAGNPQAFMGEEETFWGRRRDGLQISLRVAGMKGLTGGLGRSSVTEPTRWGSGNAGADFPLSIVSVQPPP